MEEPNTITLSGNTYYKVKSHNIYYWEVRALYKKEDTDDYVLYMYDTITEYLNIKVPSMSYVKHIMEDK